MKRIIALIDINKKNCHKNQHRLQLAFERTKNYYPNLKCKAFDSGIIGSFSNENETNILSKDTSIDILFQGNLYIKTNGLTDEEFIRRVYNKNGVSALKNLNGSFNIIILDRNLNKLFLITDRYLSRPLFIYDKNGKFILASEVKIILDLLERRPLINWSAWGQYLTYRFTLANNTFFEDIRWVDPGTIIEYDLSNHNAKIQQYWSYAQISTDYKKTEEEKIDEGVDVFKSVFGRLGKNLDGKKAIIALSAGYDSRSIVSGLTHFSKNTKFDTITTLHPCGSEVEIVKQISQILKFKNTYLDRPENIYQRFYAQKASLVDGLVQEHLWAMPMINFLKNYDAYIDGIAGDIILRSTRVRPVHIKMANDSAFLSKLFKKQFGFEYGWLQKYVSKETWDKIRYQQIWAEDCFNKIPVNENRFQTFLMMYRIRNGVSLSPNNIIGSAVENVYQPFFDNEMVEFGMSVQHNFKFKGLYRKILDKAFPELVNVTSTSDINPEKELQYDKRIIDFDSDHRELISDYLPVSDGDVKYLHKFVMSENLPSFIDKSLFLQDYENEPKFNRLTTIADILMWQKLTTQ